MIPSPELQLKITEWRQKAAAGTMTKEDYIEAVAAMRKGRGVAEMVSEKARTVAAVKTKAKSVVPSADQMLAEIGLFAVTNSQSK